MGRKVWRNVCGIRVAEVGSRCGIGRPGFFIEMQGLSSIITER